MIGQGRGWRDSRHGRRVVDTCWEGFAGIPASDYMKRSILDSAWIEME